jgi:hypothetical protein
MDETEPLIEVDRAIYFAENDILWIDLILAEPSDGPVAVEIDMGDQWRRVVVDDKNDDPSIIWISEWNVFLTDAVPRAIREGRDVRVRTYVGGEMVTANISDHFEVEPGGK